jgi:hypothetical protein
MVRVESIRIDGIVVATVMGLVFLCALFAGLISVLATRSENLLASLQESARGSTAGPPRALGEPACAKRWLGLKLRSRWFCSSAPACC